jgi:hypothetical protein
MIERINWPELLHGKLPSPFLRGAQERPLGITFYTSSLAALPETETEALEALSELSHLPQVRALQTEADEFPRIELGDFESNVDHIPVKVTHEDGSSVQTGTLLSPQDLSRIAARLVHEDDLEHSDTKAMLSDLATAQAHRALDQDILVTSSARLLANRNELFVRESNPRKPTEAAKVLGLFLRCRDNYTYQAGEKGKFTDRFDRGLFYWVLVRHRLPGMWRYFSACVESAKVRSDDILHLGQSILTRCVRALQARDNIGERFYCPQDNNTRNDMMYHFDYLSLLLAGAFDAEARIARRTYGISSPKERYASFRNPEYQQALQGSGAQHLCELVFGKHFQDVMTLLYTMRNTIHGSGLLPVGYGTVGQPQESRITVPARYQEDLWNATERHGSTERWGITRLPSGNMFVEPYTYSVILVDECFSMINAIAAATDVNMLFPKGYPVPSLMIAPPDEKVFAERIRKRLAILG